MPDIFDPKEGIKSVEAAYVRDVSKDLADAEALVKGLKKPMLVEELVKEIQKTCNITNDEAFAVIKAADAELKPKEEPKAEPVEP